MAPQQLIKFMHQTRIAMHVSERDFLKRMLATGFMVGVTFFMGEIQRGVLIGATITFFEILHHILLSRVPAGKKNKNVLLAFLYWINCLLSGFPYLAFAVLLSNHNGIAFVLGGYIWLFASYVQISNTFGLLSYYNWSLIAPGFVTAFLMFQNSANQEITPSSASDWLLVSAMMVAYIVNTVETMLKHTDTEKALSRAREDADSRLIELEYLTRHDKLTGLKNRHAFDEELTAMLAEQTRSNSVTVFLIDLDDFKPINDSYSHLAGDTVLVAVAENLIRVAGKGAIVSRLGGDEFAVAVPHITSDQVAIRLGNYILRALEAPIFYDQKMLRVGASLGIARSGHKMFTPGELCAGADQAMYRAKSDPEASVVLYCRDDFAPRLTLEDRNTLSQAIQKNQIIPYYQPKVSPKFGKIVGFEALARWNHPDRGIIGPKDFLPMIAEFGLHGDLLGHMAQQVLADMDQILKAGLDCGQISINVPEVTLATLSGRLELASQIDAYPHLRKHLTFEITEDVFIARAGDMIQRSITFFRESGIRVSLDDFGTGFASFQHLRVLEFDELKLDTSFVQGLGVDPAAGVLVDSFLSIGKGLGVQVVAEGVESPEQLSLLQKMGCEVVQGHLFGAAMPLHEAIALLKNGRVCPIGCNARRDVNAA